MKKLLFLFLLIAAIACSPAKKFQALPEVQAWEKDIRKFEKLDSASEYPEDAILFMGSSSIRLWKTLEQDMVPYPVIQRGFGGSKLSDFAVYTERIVKPHKCRAIVVFIANDISGSESDKSPEEVAGLFKYMLKTIRRSHPDTPVFWIAVTPSAARWKVWPEIKKAGELIATECGKSKNTFYIRTDTAFIGKSGLPMEELFIQDKLHLNEAGYVIWTDIIKKAMKDIVPPPKVKTIAHRGASYLAPENTVAAARLAWELGADAVECDIHLSQDKRIIVNHDATTKRTTGEQYTIAETGSEILRSLDAGSFKDASYKGEKLPFLGELLETVPEGKEIVIEIKCGPEVLPFLKEALSGFGTGRQVSFIAFDFKTIAETRKMFPDKPCYWLCSNKDLLEKTLEQVPLAGLQGVSLNFKLITRDVAEKVRSMGMELYTWTVDDPAEARRLLSLGVKGITTNRPGWLNEQVYN